MAPKPVGFQVTVERDIGNNDADVMARFVFGAAAVDPERDFVVNVPCLQPTPMAETWRYPGGGQATCVGDVRTIAAGNYLLLAWTAPLAGDIRGQARMAYKQLIDVARTRAYPKVIKAWNYIPDINRGDGDRETYKQFCQGRAEALEPTLREQPMPAGTAVGTSAKANLQIFVLASTKTPRTIENPRQTAAYRYPRQYGPRSPSFSRAALLDDGRLFVSGTAAIVGHRSQHIDNPQRQILETLDNWQALLRQTRDLGLRQPKLIDGEAFRVYLRAAQYLPQARELLQAEGIDRRCIYLQADICRRELDFELEGVLTVRPNPG